MSSKALDLFGAAVSDIANGPRTTSFQDLTASLMRRLSEKGLTLEQLADRKMLNRSLATLKSHCRKYEISFPDYTPKALQKPAVFCRSGDFYKLGFGDVDAVANALGIVVTGKGDKRSCGIPFHGWADARSKLLAAGFKIRVVKKPKVAAHV